MKGCVQNQLMLFPYNFIPQNDSERIINRIINNLDFSSIENTFKEKGRSAYPPELLLKIIIYSFFRITFSSCKVEDPTANGIRFMWLAGMPRPDYITINNFRSGKLTGTLNEIFLQIVKLFVKEKMVILSTEGLKPRSNRPADVEQCFGNFKWNKKLTRFLLRGLEKIEIEFGLLVPAHNIGKYVVKVR
ncbi:MAG: transposase [Odoribacter sp.]